MTTDQITIVAILVVTIGMFLWGRWRHDVVAMGALLACVFFGLVPGNSAFSGFAHPAVITVGCVLVLGYGLQISGAVDVLAQRLLPSGAGLTLGILALISLAALLSGFMNNVGALALLMPIAIQMAGKHDVPAGKILMPLAFGSILGGMTTLIGTPPNLIVSGYRATAATGGTTAFAMFDFAPVGAAVAVCGVLFIGLIGWRLVPARKQAGSAGFESGTYFSEVRIVAGSKAENKTLRELDEMLEEVDAQIVGIARHDIRIAAPKLCCVMREGDILVIEVEPESLAAALSSLGLKLEEEVHPSDAAEPEDAAETAAAEAPPETVPARNVGAGETTLDEKTDEKTGENKEEAEESTQTQEFIIQELVVMPDASLVDRTATDIELRTRYGINLLAISRQGSRSTKRLRSTALRAGDVLLMQGTSEALSGFAIEYGCLPLATRDIHVPKQGHALAAALIMGIVVATAALNIFPVAVAFAAGALAFIVLQVVPLRAVYTAVDWPVVVLLGAMFPLADAMASTGAADMLAHLLLDSVAQGNAIVALVLVLVVTMFLSDLMNNAATAAVMCPIGVSTAQHLGVNPDAFLMAIAVGASCAFLTPIGHQNNTLILGPGGFRFGDYWRLGLLLEAIVVAVSVPMLLWVWPL